MSNKQKKQKAVELTDVESEQAQFSRRLGELATRFAAQYTQAQLDFDHTLNDGLGRRGGNSLRESLGVVTLLDRGVK